MTQIQINYVRILWIEDQARQGALLNCTQKLERTGSFELTILQDATRAEQAIKQNAYDKILFDVRILPGNSEYWQQEHNKFNLKLGIKLLQRVITVIKDHGTAYGLITIEEWANIERTIMNIDPKFDRTKQYRRKEEFVYADKIITFINELK